MVFSAPTPTRRAGDSLETTMPPPTRVVGCLETILRAPLEIQQARLVQITQTQVWVKFIEFCVSFRNFIELYTMASSHILTLKRRTLWKQHKYVQFWWTLWQQYTE